MSAAFASDKCRVIDLEAGMPSSGVALARLDAEIKGSAALGFAAVKLIHGYGSSGTGGRIRSAVLRQLAAYLDRGSIALYVPGESFTIFDERTRRLTAACPELSRDTDLERCNSGVTFVLLRSAR